MWKNAVAAAVLCFSAISAAHAVDANSADRAALSSINGIGPNLSAQIIKEREANGPFASAEDLASRIRGIGQKNAAHWVRGGLTFGQS